MAERLFGMETEYGLAVRGRDKTRLSRAFNWAERFLDVAAQCLPHLPSADGGGLFLPNGARPQYRIDWAGTILARPRRWPIAGSRSSIATACPAPPSPIRTENP